MKRLSFRFVRRLMLLLALVFPVVYLMGGFVAALAGSHGNVTLAQDEEVVVSSKVVDFNQLNVNPSFDGSTSYYSQNFADTSFDGSFVGVTTSHKPAYLTFAISPTLVVGNHYFISLFSSCSLSDNTKSCVLRYSGSESGLFHFVPSATLLRSYGVFTPSNLGSQLQILFGWNAFFDSGVTLTLDNIIIVDLTQMYGAGNEPTADVFLSRYNADSYDYTLSTKLVEEITETPTYSEYLFNQILGSDNIIKQWGYYSLSDEDKGFAPFATLIKIVDDNFFHLGDSNDLGLFVYGYVYYALNIVAIYELVALVVMVFTIPLKLTDRFTKEM